MQMGMTFQVINACRLVKRVLKVIKRATKDLVHFGAHQIGRRSSIFYRLNLFLPYLWNFLVNII